MYNPIINMSDYINSNETYKNIEPILRSDGFIMGERIYLSSGDYIDAVKSADGSYSNLTRCTPIKDKNTPSAEELKNIKKDILNGTSQQQIMRKYELDPELTKFINMMITIETKRTYKQPSEEEVLNIYETCKTGKPDEEIAKEFEVSVKTVYYIRTLALKRYQVILKGKEPITRNIPRVYLSEEKALEIYNDFKEGKLTGIQIHKKHSISEETGTRIKFLRPPYDFLYKYGCVPITAGNKHATESEEEAITIYKWMKENQASIKETCKHFHHGSDVIQAIRNCNGYYSFLKDKYNLEPITGYFYGGSST